jgi:hypothetical protein
LKKKSFNKEEEEKQFLPTWLRYMLIVLAILYLIAIAFKQGGPPSDNFPSFRRW